MQQHNDPPRVCASIPGESPTRLTQRVSQANKISDIPPMKNVVPHPHQETWFGQLTHTRKDYMRLILIFKKFFLCGLFFFKVFIEFVPILLIFNVLGFCLQHLWDLSSSTRDRTHIPCIERWSLNHWTARQVPDYTHFGEKKNGPITASSIILCWIFKV